VIDGDPVGPAYRIEFPFPLRIAPDLEDPPQVKGREIVVPKVLEGKLWAAFLGLAGTATENGATITNTRTGTGIAFQGDQPLVEYRFYAERTAVCPEPFIRIEVAPGREKSWETRYTLLAAPKSDIQKSPKAR
jgi:hypothetical protein